MELTSMRLVNLVCFVGIATFACMTYAEESEHVAIKASSAEFDTSFSDAISKLQNKGFGSGLYSASLNAMTSQESQQTLAAIKAKLPISGVSLGSPDVEYDVILQPGHYLRTHGALGTSGALVSEMELVAYITGKVADSLRQSGLNVLVISADNFLKVGLHGKVFLAIHADGSETRCSTGPSLAYDRGSSPFAMHAIGWGLSTALGYVYSDFRRDNFTVNEAHYYAFGYIKAPLMKGLLEVGELTCRASEEALISNSDAIAMNVGRALVFVSGR